MTSVRQPEPAEQATVAHPLSISPLKFADSSPSVPEKTQENESSNQRESSPRDGRMDSAKNAGQDDGGLDSDISDHEAPKEFKEGGYGWYVRAK